MSVSALVQWKFPDQMLRSRLISVSVLMIVIVGCDSTERPLSRSHANAESVETRPSFRETVLKNMPVNSGKRCVGISIVTEALLDGDILKENACDEVEVVSRRIYNNLAQGEILQFHKCVIIDGKSVAIESPAAIEKLSTLVTDYYKEDHYRLAETGEGTRKLITAQNSVLASTDELDRLLDLDKDKLDAFCGTGMRYFPDSSKDKTHHVFLIGKRSDGEKYVYDSNSPGVPISCRIENSEHGVLIQWSCRYRDTGQTTSQVYRIVPKDTFFRQILSK